MQSSRPRADDVVRKFLRPLAPLLDDAEVTEITVNRPGEVWSLSGAGWTRHPMEALGLGHLQTLAKALITYSGATPGPIASVTLPDGERGQIIQPPACIDGMLSMTIRKHMRAVKSLDQLADEFAFDAAVDVSFNQPDEKECEALAHVTGPQRLSDTDRMLLQAKARGDWPTFLRSAVQARKNIAIAGRTGSGKTTLARSLIELIDPSERLVTIEDVHELALPNHPNRVHLIYGRGATPTQCLRESLRLSPDRLFLSELRGDEAWDYVSSCNTGHPGSITTCHADSAIKAYARVATLIKQSEVGRRLDMDLIKSTLYTTLEVVVFMDRRSVREVFFDPIFARSKLL